MGVGAVVQGADDDRSRSGAVPASSAAGVLDALGPPARAYGPRRTVPGAAGTLEPAARAGRRCAAGTCRPAAWCACCRATAATVVDGSAPAIADLAAFGALRTDRALRYAADLDDAGAARPGRARGVVRHQRLQPPARLRRRAPARQHGLDRARRREALRGLGAAGPVPAPRHRRADRRARGRRRGFGPRRLLARLRPVPRAPAVRGARRRPVDRVAGRPRAGHRSPSPRRRLHGAARRRPRRPACPTATARVASTAWRSTAASSPCTTGGTACTSGLRGVARAERADRARRPSRRPARAARAASASCASPACGRPRRCARRVLVEHALRGADLRRAGLTYLFDRTTGDDPLRPRVVTGARSRGLVRDQQDGERGWARAIAPPAARAWRADAWVSVAPETPDHVLDAWTGGARDDGLRRLLALRGARAQPRVVGLRRRSARARGSPAGSARAARGFSGARGRRARSARCASSAPRCACASRPACGWSPTAAPTAPLAVAGDGTIALPAPLRARTVRIEVLDAAFPRGTPGMRPAAPRRRHRGGDAAPASRAPPPARRRRAAPAVRRRPGAAPRRARRCACAWPATAEAIDAGRPLRAAACGAPVALPAAPVTVRADAAPWRLDHVRLALARAGHAHAGRRRRARGRSRARRARRARRRARGGATARSWLVLGESYDARLARALRRALARARPSRCRATPTGGRWTAAVATCPSPSLPTARCSPATSSRWSRAWRCWRCSSCAARAAAAAVPGAAARRARARLAAAPRARGGRGRRARARLRLRPARRRGPRPADLPRALARRLGAHAGAAGGRRPARRRAGRCTWPSGCPARATTPTTRSSASPSTGSPSAPCARSAARCG